MLAQWWGPRKYETVVDKLEPKTGGQWRFINRATDGGEHGHHTVFHLVEASQRLVQTFEYECATSNVLMESMTLEERNGKTVVTAHSLFQSVEDREGMLAGGGKEEGSRETYAKLDELLAKD